MTRVAGETVGDYTITPSEASDSNYVITFVLSTFEITQANLTVTATSGLSKVYGEIDPTLTYSITGFVNSDAESSLDTGVTMTRVAGETVGDYTITPSEAHRHAPPHLFFKIPCPAFVSMCFFDSISISLEFGI